MTFIFQLKMSFVSRNEASFQELEIPFRLVITTQIRSLFLRSKTFLSGIESLFPESNFRSRNWNFFSTIETPILGTKIRIES